MFSFQPLVFQVCHIFFVGHSVYQASATINHYVNTVRQLKTEINRSVSATCGIKVFISLSTMLLLCVQLLVPEARWSENQSMPLWLHLVVSNISLDWRLMSDGTQSSLAHCVV